MKYFERQLDTVIAIILIVICIWFLCGCKAKQTVIKETVETITTDTTKTTTDSTAVEINITDTTKTETTGGDSLMIEFVDTGGSVTIDSTGAVTLTGVKAIRAGAVWQQKQQAGRTETGKIVETGKKEDKGISAKENRHTEKAEKAARRWYENVLIRIGGLCCIAVIIWAIFLYIKRKF